MDFACLSKGRKATAAFLERSGCQPDRRFNNLNGDRQMYFVAPSGRPIDVMVDRLTMCHVLDFRPGYGRLPLTLDAIDILLSKLQIVELNEKDARDIFQLLAGLPVGAAGSAAGRPASTPTGSASCSAAGLGLVAHRHRQPGQAARARGREAGAGPCTARRTIRSPMPRSSPRSPGSVPKGMKWKLRANVGDRVRWYELPEEVGH